MSSESSVTSLYKKLKFVMLKLSFDAYSGLQYRIMHHLMWTLDYAYIIIHA